MNIRVFNRNIQLYKLGIADLNIDEKKIYDFLVDNLSELDTYISEETPGDLYFGKDKNTIIMYYDSKKRYIHISYTEIWEFIELEIYIQYSGIESLIIWWVKKTLDLNIEHIDGVYPEVIIHEDFTRLKLIKK